MDLLKSKNLSSRFAFVRLPKPFNCNKQVVVEVGVELGNNYANSFRSKLTTRHIVKLFWTGDIKEVALSSEYLWRLDQDGKIFRLKAGVGPTSWEQLEDMECDRKLRRDITKHNCQM